MKCALIILLWLLPWIAHSAETAGPGTDVDGILIEPSNGEIEIGTVLTLTFPTPMVGTADLDVPGRPWPFTGQPELQGEFLWKSQTEGVFTVKQVKAGAAYHLSLAPGLKDLASQPVQPQTGAQNSPPRSSLSKRTSKLGIS
jgi:hypothetical protein